MLPSYESPLRFQEGWSSLQTHSRTPRNPPRGLTLQMGMLGNLKARTALRMCSKNLQLAPNCGTWARVLLRRFLTAIEDGACFRKLSDQGQNRGVVDRIVIRRLDCHPLPCDSGKQQYVT